MTGTVILRHILLSDPAVSALVSSDKIIVDDAFPQGFVLPGILIGSVSTELNKVVKRGSRRHHFEHVSTEIHCSDSPTRRDIKHALMKAGDQKFPTRDGLENIVVEFIKHVADGISQTTNVRMAESYFRVSWSEPVT